jgi:hypothetical protein
MDLSEIQILIKTYNEKKKENDILKTKINNELLTLGYTPKKIHYLIYREDQIKQSIKWINKKRGYIEGEIRKKGPKPKPKPPKEPKPRGRPKKIKTTDEETTEEITEN